MAFTMLQNQYLLHDRAVHQSRTAEVSDFPLPESKSNRGLRSDYLGPISLTIPKGKAVARPAERLSEKENAQIARAHYGGEGDKPHLGM